MTAVLSKRRQFVWPLLGSAFEKGVALDCPSQALATDWTFRAGRLQMRANLSGAAIELPAAEGEIFHVHGNMDKTRGMTGGYSALFAVAR